MDKVKELQAALKRLETEATELEGKVEAETDETKAKVLSDLHAAKVAEFEETAKKIEAAKAKITRAKRVADLTVEPTVDDKSDKLDGDPEDGKMAGKVTVPNSAHNLAMECKERDDASRAYLTAAPGEAKAALSAVMAQKPKLFDAITVVRDGKRQTGIRPPSYMANFINAKMSGWTPSSIREALSGKANENVLARDASGTQSGGGSLVPDLFEGTLYKLPQLDSRLIDLCFVKSAVGAAVYFPKLTQSTDRFGVHFHASTEGNAKPKSNPNFTRVSVTPGEISGLTLLSTQELRVNNVGLEAELAWSFRGAWNEFINRQILQKSDANSSFTGINTDAAIALGVVPVAREAAGAVSWADLMGLVFGVEAGAMADLTMVVKSGSTGALAYVAKLDDTNNRPVFQNLLSASWAGGAQNPPQIAGCPYIATPDNDATVGNRGDFICGAFRNYAVAVEPSDGMTIDRSDDFMFDQAMVAYRIIGRAGGLPLGYSCFSVLAEVSGASSSSTESSSASATASSGADDNE